MENASMRLVDVFGAGLLLSVLWLVSNRRVDRAVVNLILQSCILTAVAVVIGLYAHVPHMFIVAGLILAVKAIAIPGLFFWVLKRCGRELEMATVLPPAVATMMAIGLVILAYYTVGSIRLPASPTMAGMLPVSVSLILLGMLIMISHTKALLQVVGLMTMENGLFLVAIATTFGMPLIVELGIFFDLLIAALVMGVFTYRMKALFTSTDTDQLNQLRG